MMVGLGPAGARRLEDGQERLLDIRVWLYAVALVLGIAGCAALNQGDELTPVERAKDVEPMLQAAGFSSFAAQTPDQMKQLQALPPQKLAYYVGGQGQTRYWYADPDYCKCVFQGNEDAYQRYEDIRLQNQLAQREQAAAEQNLAAQQQMMMMGPVTPFGFGVGPGVGVGFMGF